MQQLHFRSGFFLSRKVAYTDQIHRATIRKDLQTLKLKTHDNLKTGMIYWHNYSVPTVGDSSTALLSLT